MAPEVKTIRVVFFGTAELACPSLGALVEKSGLEVAAVVTQPDRPKGRDLQLQPPPVKVEARRRHLTVLQPEKARDPHFMDELAVFRPDLIVVVAYGQILRRPILELPRYGCVNVHASLLPKYRGAAPIQWSILEDQAETGVTIMKMDEGLDTGDILSQEALPIEAQDTAQTLHDKLATLGARLLIRTVPDYIEGRITAKPQPATGVSYARKITKEDGKLDWNLPARALWNRVRAFTPWPGAWTYFSSAGDKTLLKVWETAIEEGNPGPPGTVVRVGRGGITVACGEGNLRILSLQREGGRRLPAQAFLAGQPLEPGQVLG